MIWKILRSEFKALQLIGVLSVMLLGFSIIMLAARFYLDIRPAFQAQDLWQHEHIIISKKISSTNTAAQLFGKGNKPSFSEREIEQLRKQSFVKDLAPFTSSSFEASAHTEGEQLGGFYTEIFFESVPSGYIDLEDGKFWKWDTQKEYVPIILPKTYLNLYNFGFATSQNLPQINEDGASAVPFRIVIRGNGLKEVLEARIVGFSDRLNTILVPQEFLDYANPRYGVKEVPVSRIILLTPDPSDPELLEFIKAKDYDYNKEQLNNGKARMLLNTATAIVIITGLIITTLSLWLFILSSQLLLQRNRKKISTLKGLGFSIRQIIAPFRNLVLSGSILVFSLGLLPYFIIRNLYRNSLEAILPEASTPDVMILLGGFLFVFVLAGINVSLIKRKIKRI